MIIQDSAIPYILKQRTSINQSTKDLYAISCWQDYQAMKFFLPQTCDDIVDIGCGVGGMALYLYQHYQKSPRLHLVDKTETKDMPGYGYSEDGRFYNSMDITRNFLIDNFVDEDDIHIIETLKCGELENIGLVVSLRAWGFHFPVEKYIDAVYEMLAEPGGVVILDVRAATDGRKLLEEYFDCYVLERYKKFLRMLCVK